MSDTPINIHVAPDAAGLAVDAADRIAASARAAIGERGRFCLALSGGSTPKALYHLLAAPPYRERIEWPRVEIYFSDERTVPPDHADSNFHMASEALLGHVPIPPEQVHRMRGEIDPNEAAIEYGRLLKDKFGDGGLDLCLLGMGDDGHTASLFPHTAALDEMRHRCVANQVEKLNTWRITMTAPFINRSRQIMILVAGASKAERLSQVLEGPSDPLRLPVQLIRPVGGQLIWMLDAAAAGMQEPGE